MIDDLSTVHTCPECGKEFEIFSALSDYVYAKKGHGIYYCSYHCFRAEPRRREALKKRIVEMYKAGAKPGEIMQETGRNYSYVYDTLREAGMKGVPTT